MSGRCSRTACPTTSAMWRRLRSTSPGLAASWTATTRRVSTVMQPRYDRSHRTPSPLGGQWRPFGGILLGAVAGTVLDGRMASTVAAQALPPARSGGNLLDDDVALIEGLRREGAAAFEDECRAFGALADTPAVIRDGFEANDHPPELVRYDPDAERADGLDFHPSWHRLMGLSVEHGIAGAPWADPRPGVHVARAAKFLMIAQAEAGITCPLAMTYSCVPALRLAETTAGWEPLVTSGIYDPRPGAGRGQARRARRDGAHRARRRVGRADVDDDAREPDGADGWRVTGAKWFVSAAQSDAFFVLAQTSRRPLAAARPAPDPRRRAERPAVRPAEVQAREPLQPDRRGRARAAPTACSSARRAAACARSWR